jgi:hypothetical protein
MKKLIETECADCSGTGLYVGMAEKGGVAVVCARCKGTGNRILTYTPFTQKHRRDDVSTVVELNPGFFISTKSEIGGISYEDWWTGKGFPPGSEMRKYTCPRWWFQCTDYDKIPKWSECDIGLGRSFSSCKHFEDKVACWKRYDKEQKND